jgi:hypothetical protein
MSYYLCLEPCIDEISPDEEERRALQILNMQKGVDHENENINPGKLDAIVVPSRATDYNTDEEVQDGSQSVLEMYRKKNKPIKPPNHTCRSRRCE